MKTSPRRSVVRRRRVVRFHLAQGLGLPVLEVANPLFDLLDALRKSLHDLVELTEQLLLIGHSLLELDDAFFHGQMVAILPSWPV